MPTTVEIHQTWKRATLIVGFAVLLSIVLVGAKKLTSESEPSLPTPTENDLHALESRDLLVPVLPLSVKDSDKEVEWSAALAKALDGRVEVVVRNGRVDVVNSVYAIEVDRLDKWHEGIGQAAHYALETEKLGCVALIVEAGNWPLSASTLEKIETIEKTALNQGIRLILIRSSLDN